ncbi:glycosyltransferase family 4 protein [Novosphingobium terrae]|uniref:glycosyltransferase family 4 protein n=1 Tax=Novosphingobium terrae TaxID=2726189 RepID=UPI00197DEA5C|nr:glycosyltransferase family 1 protein [Novosphingobium terrae]
MRIGIDGYNLAIPNGTGVATYGASLAHVAAEMGHGVEAVFGIDPGRKPSLRETLFFEQFGHGHQGNVGKKVRNSVIWWHLARRLTEIPLTDNVDKRGFGARWPAFDRLWTSPLLFEVAWARFTYLKQFTTVTMPNPPDVMHWTYPVPIRMAGSRNVYTLHDLVPLKLPHTTRDNKHYYHRLIEACLFHGDHIATVSEASRSDILAMFRADPDKVTNTYQSSPLPESVVQSSAEQDRAMIESVFGLPAKGFYLFFGATDPKKNIGRVVDAYLASQSERPLVVISSRDWGMSEASGGLGAGGTVYGRKVDRPIVQLQYLPRDMLFRLIRSARAVLFPSLYEGFGLPALEALQLGTPVISSNTASLPEVVGAGGLLVDPYETIQIADAIRALDHDDALYDRLSQAGLAHAKGFTNEAFAERLQGMYMRMGLER